MLVPLSPLPSILPTWTPPSHLGFKFEFGVLLFSKVQIQLTFCRRDLNLVGFVVQALDSLWSLTRSLSLEILRALSCKACC